MFLPILHFLALYHSNADDRRGRCGICEKPDDGLFRCCFSDFPVLMPGYGHYNFFRVYYLNMAFSNSRFANIPPVTRNLIIINVLIWLVEFLFPSFAENTLYRFCGLHYMGGYDFNPAQIFTYMFLHDYHSFIHVFFNMFTLFMFGPILERVWGSKRYLLYYVVCGIGAALVQEGVWALTWKHEYIAGIAKLNGLTYDHMASIVDEALANGDTGFFNAMAQMKNSMITVGASGAIFGLLLGFAFVFPDMPLYLFFIPIPIKAKWMVLGYGVLEFFLGVNGGGTVAHFAHLGGMLFGLILLLIWKKKGTLRGGSFY